MLWFARGLFCVALLVAVVGALRIVSRDDRPAPLASPEPERPRHAPPPRARPAEPEPLPSGPALTALSQPSYAARVERLRGCVARGDAVVTVESAEGKLWVVMYRQGKRCFRLAFPEESTALLEPMQLFGLQGEAGPLGIVHVLPRSPVPEDPSAPHERRYETHLIVVSWEGRLLLHRSLGVRSFHVGATRSETVDLLPLLWDGETLITWASTQGHVGHATQCVGSLVYARARGPMEVAEGLPCEAMALVDVGEGWAIHAASRAVRHRDATWQAIVAPSGDLLASSAVPHEASVLLLRSDGGPALGSITESGPAILPWPWVGPALSPQRGTCCGGSVFATDLDGDGDSEFLLSHADATEVYDTATGRFLYRFDGTLIAHLPGPEGGRAITRSPGCDLGVFDGKTPGRCASSAVGPRGKESWVGAFEWRGGPDADLLWVDEKAASLRLHVWSGDGWLSTRTARSLERLLPRHSTWRALALTPAGAPELLVGEGEDFVVIGVPGDESRLRFSRDAGILRAVAMQIGGRSDLRHFPLTPRWGRL